MSQRELTGIGMPAIEECPECGSETLYATTISVNSTSLGLDGNGGVAQWHDDVLQDTLIMSMECAECDTVLVEDAEPVHEEVA